MIGVAAELSAKPWLRYDLAPNHQLRRRNSMCTQRVRLFPFIIIALISSVWLCVSAQTTATKVPLTHETMWMLKRVGAPAPSPDGKWVVFSLVEPAYDEKDQTSDLWIVATDGSTKPRRLTSTKGGESGVDRKST